MKTQPIDTHPELEDVYIEEIRQMTVAQKISRMSALTSAFMKRSKQKIHRANPKVSQDGLDVLFVKCHYGEELDTRFQIYLQQKKAKSEGG